MHAPGRRFLLTALVSTLASLFIASSTLAQQFGSALRFSGFDQAAVAGPLAPSTTGELTLEFRMRIEEVSLGITSLVGNYAWPDFVDGGFFVGVLGHGLGLPPGLYVVFNTTTQQYQTPALPLSLGRWHHVALRIGSGLLELRVDGAPWLSLPYQGTPLESTAPFRIGPTEFFGQDGTVVTIDEVRVWSTLRSDTELSDWMHRPIPFGSPLEADMRGYWPLDDAAGAVAASRIDPGNPAAIGPGAGWTELAPCPADLLGEGQVDGAEMARFGRILAFGTCETGVGCPGDVDGNGTVDEADLGELVAAFGDSSCRTRHVHAVVEAMVEEAPYPQAISRGFQGMRFDMCTGTYLPELGVGTQGIASDANAGIGGSTTGLWTRYASLPITWAGEVLVDWRADHWPGSNWDMSACSGEWEPASGFSEGRPGAISTGTDSSCWRIGWCVRYAPMDEADGFISASALTAFQPCPFFCESNGAQWPMEQDPLDIHRGCGDSRFVYLCRNRDRLTPPKPDLIDIQDDAEKLALLETYAPRVWIHSNESYMPASVDWTFAPYDWGPRDGLPKMERFLHGDGRYWIRSVEVLPEPSDVVDYFRGPPEIRLANPDRVPVQDVVPVYAFWSEKQIGLGGGETTNFIDLIYFLYYPYNRGKEVLNTIFGNHVGDWEHVTVRLGWKWDELSGWVIGPLQVYVSAHDFGGAYRWEDPLLEKAGTHPVVYQAWGSHGLWVLPGNHVYDEIPVLGTDLVDETNVGEPWDTWLNVVGLDFNARSGLGGEVWPFWMDTDFSDPGACGDPTDPACGPVYRWGNVQHPEEVFGQRRLENGPTGPVSKGVMTSETLQ